MAGKEGLPQEKRGILERAVGKGKRFSLLTLPLGVGVGVYGIATANPVATRIGFGAAGIDVIQLGLTHTAEKRLARRRRRKEARGLAKSATIIEFPKIVKRPERKIA